MLIQSETFWSLFHLSQGAESFSAPSWILPRSSRQLDRLRCPYRADNVITSRCKSHILATASTWPPLLWWSLHVVTALALFPTREKLSSIHSLFITWLSCHTTWTREFRSSKVTFQVLLNFQHGLCVAQADKAVRNMEPETERQNKATGHS